MPLLAGLGPLGVPELLIIAFIVVLVFGVGRLGDVGGAMGKGIREFRNATKDEDPAASKDASTDAVAVTPEAAAAAAPAMATSAPASETPATETPASAATAADAIFCSECGARNLRAAKFCAECGKPIAAPVS